MRDFLLTYANDIATLIGGLVGLGLNFVKCTPMACT